MTTEKPPSSDADVAEMRRRIDELYAVIQEHHLRTGINGVSWVALIPAPERVIVIAGPNLEDLQMMVEATVPPGTTVEYIQVATRQ